jgi:putative membrane protein
LAGKIALPKISLAVVIVRPRPHWIRLLFARRGSLVHRILSQQLFIFALAVGVVVMHGSLFHWKVTLTSGPFSLMGVALAIFLGFRINTSYDRYWEARKLWGGVLVDVRNLARKMLSVLGDTEAARPFVHGLIGFTAAMRNQLRGEVVRKDTQRFLPSGLMTELDTARFPPAMVLLWLGRWIHERRDAGALEPVQVLSLEESLDRLSAALGGCERIAGTPLPFTYSVILHRSAYLYCMLLPFGLVDVVGVMTPLVVTFISYTFFALEALSDEIEDPFGRAPNDLALDAMLIQIESTLKEMLGEPLPAPMLPDANFILS